LLLIVYVVVCACVCARVCVCVRMFVCMQLSLVRLAEIAETISPVSVPSLSLGDYPQEVQPFVRMFLEAWKELDVTGTGTGANPNPSDCPSARESKLAPA
jgi:hypothetical protein